MQKDIQPQYEAIEVRCACGNTFKAGSVKDEIKVEILPEPEKDEDEEDEILRALDKFFVFEGESVNSSRLADRLRNTV